jgi:hypothetical protein
MKRVSRAAIVASVMCGVVVSVAQASDGDQKVLLCHATNAATNPYELISIDEHGAAGHLQAGHGDGDHTDFLPAEGSSDCSTGGPEE